MAKHRNDLSFADLEAGLRIDQNALDECIIQQPDLFYRVSKQLALAISRRDEAKKAIEDIEAEIDQKVRTRIPSDEKVTEGDIKAQVRMDKRVKAAVTNHLQLARQVLELDALKDAYKQRSYAFNQLNDLQMMGYFGGDTSSGKIKTAIAERAKREMNEERQRNRDRH